MTTPGVMQAATLHDFHVHVYRHAGVPADDAHLAAAVRVESLLRQPEGLNTFAVARLRHTVQRLQDGGINPSATAHHRAGATALCRAGWR